MNRMPARAFIGLDRNEKCQWTTAKEELANPDVPADREDAQKASI
jgi:hypothetical protein